jgi:integrase
LQSASLIFPTAPYAPCAWRRCSACGWPVRTTSPGAEHLSVSGKGGKKRYLPPHAGTNGLINDYLDAAGHGEDLNGAVFRPIRNRATGKLDKAITPDGIYKLVRAYSAELGTQIGAHALRATAATNALDHLSLSAETRENTRAQRWMMTTVLGPRFKTRNASEGKRRLPLNRSRE